MQQYLGQTNEGRCRFDLENEPEVLGVDSPEVRLDVIDVSLVA